MSETCLTVTEASRNFADVVNRCYYRGESTLLMKSGEAVAKMVSVGGGAHQLGRDWLKQWKTRPRLEQEDAQDFAQQLAEARENLPTPTSPWESY